MHSIVIAAAMSMTVATSASADPIAIARPTTPEPARSRHLIYGELLGKGGPYGFGYEHAITSRLGIGAVGSIAGVRGEQFYTVAPYVHGTLLGRHRHALFSEVGLIVSHHRVPSPVPEWEGVADTGAGGFVSLGYELRVQHFIGRAYIAVAVGEGGVAPFGGLAIGFSP
jgi:hypothetical protein